MSRTMSLKVRDRLVDEAPRRHSITAPARRASRGEVTRRLLMVIALYAIPAVMVMRPVTDPDIWWHLRTGQWIVEHGAVPTTDPFSSFGLGKPWVAYSWLFELLVYGLYRGLGLGGILLYRVVLTLAVALSVHRLVAKREPRFAVALGLVGAALLALLPLMNERPWLFTILFSALTLDVVLDLRAGRSTRAAWLLPPLFALWANLHIQFVYGLFLLALA
jgi:GNAT superfamily N-acetyltransferase